MVPKSDVSADDWNEILLDENTRNEDATNKIQKSTTLNDISFLRNFDLPYGKSFAIY